MRTMCAENGRSDLAVGSYGCFFRNSISRGAAGWPMERTKAAQSNPEAKRNRRSRRGGAKRRAGLTASRRSARNSGLLPPALALRIWPCGPCAAAAALAAGPKGSGVHVARNVAGGRVSRECGERASDGRACAGRGEAGEAALTLPEGFVLVVRGEAL